MNRWLGISIFASLYLTAHLVTWWRRDFKIVGLDKDVTQSYNPMPSRLPVHEK